MVGLNSQSSERRRHPRVKHNVPLKISSDEIDLVTDTHNLSCSGAYCQVSRNIEPMTKLKIHLLLPFKKKEKIVTKKITCEGVVVRSESVSGENRYNIAIFFNDLSRKDNQTLSEYIHSGLEAESVLTSKAKF